MSAKIKATANTSFFVVSQDEFFFFLFLPQSPALKTWKSLILALKEVCVSTARLYPVYSLHQNLTVKVEISKERQRMAQKNHSKYL